jgi:hypothetical protein
MSTLLDKAVSLVVGFVVLLVIVAAVVYIFTPMPRCPDGEVLAGGGYGGRYHCVPGSEPIFYPRTTLIPPVETTPQRP